MCSPSWELTRLVRDSGPRLCVRLPDGRLLDLQAAHVATRGSLSPHLRDAVSFRLAAAYGTDLVDELVRAAPSEAIVAA